MRERKRKIVRVCVLERKRQRLCFRGREREGKERDYVLPLPLFLPLWPEAAIDSGW